jgi:hypothetical protein
MTARDRIVVIVLATFGVLAAVWFLAVAPKREQAAKLATEVSAAQSQLASAESQLSSASAAQAKYQTAYASIVNLGKAVPAGQEVPSLIYQLAQATNEKNVEFASITTTVPGASPGSAAGPAAAASASATASAGFTQMPFTFVFNGGFDSLYSLFRQLDGFTLSTHAGLRVSGRLLTIQSVKLALNTSSGTSAGGSSAGGSAQGTGSKPSSEQITSTITATAYVLPAGQTLTGGATPSGPAGASAQTASTGAAGASPPAAVVRVSTP